MKVIQNGKTHSQVTCSFCACVFEYDDVDIRPLFLPDWIDGGPNVTCPECDRVTGIVRKVVFNRRTWYYEIVEK